MANTLNVLNPRPLPENPGADNRQVIEDSVAAETATVTHREELLIQTIYSRLSAAGLTALDGRAAVESAQSAILIFAKELNLYGASRTSAPASIGAALTLLVSDIDKDRYLDIDLHGLMGSGVVRKGVTHEQVIQALTKPGGFVFDEARYATADEFVRAQALFFIAGYPMPNSHSLSFQSTPNKRIIGVDGAFLPNLGQGVQK